MKNLLTLVAVFAVFTASTGANADIINGDFESNAVGGFPAADSWDSGAGVGLNASFPHTGSQGSGFGFTSETAEQELSDTYAANTSYTLQSLSLDNDSNDFDLIYTLGYFDDFAVFQSLNSATYSMDDTEWTLLAGVTYATGGSGDELGKEIVVRLATSGDQGVWFDNVTINSVSVPNNGIPTPAALPTGLALLGLIAARRRREN